MSKPSKSDFASSQEVRWCPGCGDYAILSSMQKVLATLDTPRESHVFVSGIGCSGRFPYYMNCYGFHTIHGRAPTVATGVALANPELTVWVITGDGDGLSIGANHLLHAFRRNANIKVLLFNNQIYGLTKGQFSPTSKPGTVSVTSPQGSVDQSVDPIAFALTAGASFVARAIDVDAQGLQGVLAAAAQHRGSVFVEILQNCHIFNDAIFKDITEKAHRSERLLYLSAGEPLTFGEMGNKGIELEAMGPQIVDLTDNNDTVCPVHDVAHPNPGYAMNLANLHYPDYPTPVGIFRQVEEPTQASRLTGEGDFTPPSRQTLENLLAGKRG